MAKIKTRRQVTINRIVRERFELRIGKQCYCTYVKATVTVVAMSEWDAVVEYLVWDESHNCSSRRLDRVPFDTLVPIAHFCYTRVN